jgi:hypothetical protein
MKITANLSAGKLTLPGAEYPISNRIRTLRDGSRKSCEVVRSIPGDYPYDPQPFPRGLWKITAVEWQREKGFDRRTYGPVKIRTNARCLVNVWALDEDGDYLEETGRTDWDTCYWLHYSEFSTTLGCIRLSSPDDATAIADAIAEAVKGGPVELEVLA